MHKILQVKMSPKGTDIHLAFCKNFRLPFLLRLQPLKI